jgi:hypothetical protein
MRRDERSIRHSWRVQVDCTLGRAAIGFNTKATNCRIRVAKPRQRRRGVCLSLRHLLARAKYRYESDGLFGSLTPAE